MIVIFCLVVFAALLAVIRFTRFGLEMRAVTQNRRMAAAMGIRTSWVDAMTFGLGSGVAGIAGVALSQIDNVSPNLGQSYIIDSFMVVVFGGVGNLWGTFTGAFTLGIVNKLLEPTVGRGPRQDPGPGGDHPVHPEAAAGPVRPQGPGGGGLMLRALPASTWVVVPLLLAVAVLVPLLNLAHRSRERLACARPTSSACSASISASPSWR